MKKIFFDIENNEPYKEKERLKMYLNIKKLIKVSTKIKKEKVQTDEL